MMAAIANNNHQPPISAAVTTTAAVSNSPRSPVKASAPWSQIVRGGEPELDPIVNANSSENVESGGGEVVVTAEAAAAAVVSKKPAWNMKTISVSNSTPINGGGSESAGGAAVVMGAEQWPSLSECTTKASPKIPGEFTVNVTDIGSKNVIGIDTSSAAKVLSPVRSPASISHKLTNNSNHHSTSNHSRPARSKSFKRDGGSNPQANGVASHQSSHAAGEGAHYHHKHDSPKPTAGGSAENSGRDNVQNHNNRDSGQRNASGEHTHHRNPFRKGNGGQHSRGDGSQQSYGGRRSDQERGNNDLNHQRSFNGRDASMQPRGVPRGFVRPSAVPAPFYPPPMQPFMNSLVPVYIGPGMQFVPPIPPIYFPAPGPELYSELMRQIDFYFSNDNLVRDTYLRRQMDENGWVAVDVISQFNRVKVLTTDTYQILEAVRPSAVVEVQGDKLRRRDDWKKWVLPPSVQFPISSGPQSPTVPAAASVTNGIQSVSLDEKSSYPKPTKSLASSGDSSSPSKRSLDEANPSGC